MRHAANRAVARITSAQRGGRTVRHAPTEPLMTRRMYLVVTSMLDTGCGISAAIEAVASIAMEHPDWDMDERRTPAEWDLLTAGRSAAS